MRIVDLEAGHHAEVRALILRGLADHWDSVDERLNPDLDDLSAAYPGGRTIVVFDDHRSAIGTGTVVPRDEGTVEIVRMSVDTNRRRGGIGRAIVEELVATARRWGADRVVLETTSAWTEVVDFYRSCGFSITHTAPSPFGEDTWFERRI
ncbi:MAG: GNAT family N-acetyltransferase [Actinomycetota bacterium]